jgi:hypothetical protein
MASFLSTGRRPIVYEQSILNPICDLVGLLACMNRTPLLATICGMLVNVTSNL